MVLALLRRRDGYLRGGVFMTRFEDGPAKGQVLMLHRAATFLRVTEVGGKFDALDQPDDTALPQENLHAYRIIGKPAMCHINAGKASGFYPIANYKLVEHQPADHEMRSSAAWKKWCEAQISS